MSFLIAAFALQFDNLVGGFYGCAEDGAEYTSFNLLSDCESVFKFNLIHISNHADQ